MTNTERYLYFARKWLNLTEQQKSGNDGQAIRATLNTCWYVLQGAQKDIAAELRPDELFQGYEPL